MGRCVGGWISEWLDFPQQTSTNRGRSKAGGTKTSFIWGRKRVHARVRSGPTILGALTITIPEMATSLSACLYSLLSRGLSKDSDCSKKFSSNSLKITFGKSHLITIDINSVIGKNLSLPFIHEESLIINENLFITGKMAME